MKFKRFEDAVEIYNRLLDAASVDAARLVLADVVSDIGFAAFAYLATDGRKDGDVPVNVTSLEPGFIDDYVAGSFWARDPAVLYATRTTGPYFWGDAYQASQDGLLPTSNWQEVDDLAMSHGYRDGLVLPVRTRETTFSMSLYSDSRLLPGDVLPELFGIGLVGLAFDSWMRTGNPGGEGSVMPKANLTPRERDVLKWLSEGKTSEEIGRILGISAKTIDFHVANILEKLDAVNRTQAVARAIRGKII